MRLVIEDAAGTRSVVPFASDEITLGRAREGNTFRLEERTVSRRHARLVRASGAVYIEDLGSLTGTRVNGERITGRRRLREGDLVEIGAYDLALLPEEDRPGAPPALRPTPAPGVGAPGAAGTPAAAPPPAAMAAPPEPPPPPAAVASVPSRSTPAPAAEVPASSSAPAAPQQAQTPAPAPVPQPPQTAAAAPPAVRAMSGAPAPVPVPPAHGSAAAVATAPAALPSSPAPAPETTTRTAAPGTLGRALLAGAVALALGFGAGWAVGVLTAGPPPGEASAAR